MLTAAVDMEITHVSAGNPNSLILVDNIIITVSSVNPEWNRSQPTSLLLHSHIYVYVLYIGLYGCGDLLVASDNVLWGGSLRLVCCTTPPTLGMLTAAPGGLCVFCDLCRALLGQPVGPTVQSLHWWHQGGLPGLYGQCEYA
jgi:hypothetical protein